MNQGYPRQAERGHEREGSNVRAIVLTGIGLLVGLAAICGLIALMVVVSMPREPGRSEMSAMDEARRPPSSPGPLDDMPAIRARLEAEQRARLASYGWVDRERGIVHIPIEEAMERIAREGLPAFEGGDSSGRDEPEEGATR